MTPVVVTVTLNPALDVTYHVPRLRVGATNRVVRVHVQAGGKGINVARVLHALGVPVLALAFAGGGAAGREWAADLDGAAVPHRLVAVPGETRRCVAVVPLEGGPVTELNEPGPEVPAAAWDEMVAAFREVLSGGARVAVLSGSLPPGLPPDAYARLCRLAQEAGVPAILDASGEALRAGLAGRPAVVKPNRDELLELVGAPAGGEGNGVGREWLPLLAEVRARGAGAVVASFGRDGLLALTGEGAWHARAPAVRGNPVGAGDAVVAALARAELAGVPWPERLRDAAALGAAAVACPAAGAFDPGVYARARAEAEVRAVG